MSKTSPDDQRRELEDKLDNLVLDTCIEATTSVLAGYSFEHRIHMDEILTEVDTYTAAQVREAEQKPVGAALEIKVTPETMQAVMSKIRLKQKTIAARVLEPLWRVEKWCDGTADEYDLEVEQWKLRILASLTRRFNWAVFLLKPDNLAVVTGQRLFAKGKP